MFKQCCGIFLGLLILVSSSYGDITHVRVNGHFLGGFSHFSQREDAIQTLNTHFTYASNIDISYQLAPSIRGLIQFQNSPGGSAYGFPGPEIVVTDLNLEYTSNQQNSTITIGSFDTPFGQQVPYLSNNANTIGNALLSNSLLYSAFAGSMGTLNTIGMMVHHTHKLGDITFALTNGTSEDASNPDNGFGTVLSYTHNINKGSIGASVMTSSEHNANGNGFNADFSATMLDVHYQLHPKLMTKSYVSLLTYGDNNAATSDIVYAAMIEGKYNYSSKTFLSARFSLWMPQDRNGSGTGQSALIPNPGFGTVASIPNTTFITDQTVNRYQVGFGHYLDENLLLKSELFYDNYEKTSAGYNTDVFGITCFLNATF